jgi:hypothetical protein
VTTQTDILFRLSDRAEWPHSRLDPVFAASCLSLKINVVGFWDEPWCRQVADSTGAADVGKAAAAADVLSVGWHLAKMKLSILPPLSPRRRRRRRVVFFCPNFQISSAVSQHPIQSGFTLTAHNRLVSRLRMTGGMLSLLVQNCMASVECALHIIVIIIIIIITLKCRSR